MKKPELGQTIWLKAIANILNYSSDGIEVSIEPESIEDSDKYDRKIELKPNGMIDVYRVIRAYEPIDTAIQHAIKKLLAGGQRGHKDIVKDYKEAIKSINDCITYLETK